MFIARRLNSSIYLASKPQMAKAMNKNECSNFNSFRDKAHLQTPTNLIRNPTLRNISDAIFLARQLLSLTH
jgi:hypothetical protein